MHGILTIDKPAGITSARAVWQVKRLLPRGTKIGHAGTLDPFATGVLLLLIGRATKLCESLMNQPKQYDATVCLGANTATDDPESEPISWPGLDSTAPPISLTQVEGIIPQFVGNVLQKPPAFSALKVGGQRAYKLARKGQPPALVPRRVMIYQMRIVHFSWPELKLQVDCGRGTYIRSIARELGDALGVGGYLTQLCRTQVGGFSIGTAAVLTQLSRDNVSKFIAPLESAPAPVIVK